MKEYEPILWSDCDLKYDEASEHYSVVLHDENGEKLILANLTPINLKELTVCIEIVGYSPNLFDFLARR